MSEDVKNYEVVESFEIDGVAQEVGAKVKLTAEQAAELGDKVKPCEAEEAGTETGEQSGSEQQ